MSNATFQTEDQAEAALQHCLLSALLYTMAIFSPLGVQREDIGRLLCQVYARPARWPTSQHACGVSGGMLVPQSKANALSSHIEVAPEHNGNLFFWHFQNRHIANRQRTVLWLNGGPGCSSMDGAMMEIGPYRVTEDFKLTYNDGSWDEFANVLFVDNPVGTGFSYVNTDSYVSELTDMADQMVTFLEKFFALFPEYENTDVSISQCIFQERSS